MEPDESALHRREYGHYQQSERKPLYKKYAEELVAKGFAYYAFDTAEELEKMRTDLKTVENPAPQYDHNVRLSMRNSLSLSPLAVQEMLENGTRYVIRIKMP